MRKLLFFIKTRLYLSQLIKGLRLFFFFLLEINLSVRKIDSVSDGGRGRISWIWLWFNNVRAQQFILWPNICHNFPPLDSNWSYFPERTFGDDNFRTNVSPLRVTKAPESEMTRRVLFQNFILKNRLFKK